MQANGGAIAAVKRVWSCRGRATFRLRRLRNSGLGCLLGGVPLFQRGAKGDAVPVALPSGFTHLRIGRARYDVRRPCLHVEAVPPGGRDVDVSEQGGFHYDCNHLPGLVDVELHILQLALVGQVLESVAPSLRRHGLVHQVHDKDFPGRVEGIRLLGHIDMPQRHFPAVYFQKALRIVAVGRRAFGDGPGGCRCAAGLPGRGRAGFPAGRGLASSGAIRRLCVLQRCDVSAVNPSRRSIRGPDLHPAVSVVQSLAPARTDLVVVPRLLWKSYR